MLPLAHTSRNSRFQFIEHFVFLHDYRDTPDTLSRTSPPVGANMWALTAPHPRARPISLPSTSWTSGSFCARALWPHLASHMRDAKVVQVQGKSSLSLPGRYAQELPVVRAWSCYRVKLQQTCYGEAMQRSITRFVAHRVSFAASSGDTYVKSIVCSGQNLFPFLFSILKFRSHYVLRFSWLIEN